MSREPSAETLLRTVKRLTRELNTELGNARRDCAAYRVRATKAEQECAEWKARFDALLFKQEQADADR